MGLVIILFHTCNILHTCRSELHTPVLYYTSSKVKQIYIVKCLTTNKKELNIASIILVHSKHVVNNPTCRRGFDYTTEYGVAFVYRNFVHTKKYCGCLSFQLRNAAEGKRKLGTYTLEVPMLFYNYRYRHQALKINEKYTVYSQ